MRTVADAVCASRHRAIGCDRDRSLMPKIHRLPVALANQIAAGEVVERPGLGRQGARRKRHRRRRAAGDGDGRVRRQAPGPRRRRRRGDGARRCAAGAGAARDEQDPDERRPGGHRDARVPRRSAAVDRLGVAPDAAHARPRRDERHRDRGARRRHRVDHRGRGAGGHADRRRGPVLQPARAAEVPQVGPGRVGPGLAHRHATGAGRPRRGILAGQRRAARCSNARRPAAGASGCFRSTAIPAT